MVETAIRLMPIRFTPGNLRMQDQRANLTRAVRMEGESLSVESGAGKGKRRFPAARALWRGAADQAGTELLRPLCISSAGGRFSFPKVLLARRAARITE